MDGHHQTGAERSLIAALFYFGRIDATSILVLVDHPWAIGITIGLTLLLLPLAALCWRLVLQSLKLKIRFIDLFHFVCIGLLPLTPNGLGVGEARSVIANSELVLSNRPNDSSNGENRNQNRCGLSPDQRTAFPRSICLLE
jgi:hypothetical protein